ncbi:hypothetical protein JCM6882_002855 [Rhodosporidiobolus microsporus]
MFARSLRVLKSAPATSRSATTAAPAPYKRTYTPRTSTTTAAAPRTAPARTASPSSTPSRGPGRPPSAATAAASKTAAAPAPAKAPVEEDEPVRPTPILDAVPDEYAAPPGLAEGASTSFARKGAASDIPADIFSSSPNPFSSSSSAGTSSSSIPSTLPILAPQQTEIDWSTSYHGLSAAPFTNEQAQILMRPLEAAEIEIKPDGLLYLPEILYRRILNKAFGPGGWGMVPRGEMTVLKNMVTREWGLVAGGRLVSVARGEQTFFDPSGMPTASEGCKSNALMRCCKDLGIASELWDPSFIRAFKAAHCIEAWTEHVVTKKKQKRWRRKHNKFEYPYMDPTK